MRKRTIALVVALALAPAGAFADTHPIDCFFGGYLYASDDLKTQGLSCGFAMDLLSIRDSTYPAQRAVPSPPPPPGAKARDWFVFPEIIRFTGDRDGDDFSRYVVTGGVRKFLGRARVQPYLQVSAGFARTSHLESTDFGGALGGGAGVDVKLAELGRHDLMARASCGVVRTFGAGSPETVAHCTPSLGIRFLERP